jgi:hypothetical protein
MPNLHPASSSPTAFAREGRTVERKAAFGGGGAQVYRELEARLQDRKSAFDDTLAWFDTSVASHGR